jgi:AcrR family transcriptional regulator
MTETVQIEQIEPADDADRALRKSGYHHGDLRAGLIEATRRLVEEKGPDGFSVSDACKLAGVSSAAPYKHFKDRNDMLVAMVLEGMARHRDNMIAALEDIPAGTPERITALGQEYVNFALRENGVFRLKFGGYTDRLEDDRLQAAGENTFGIVMREVAACLGEPDVTQKVRERSFMLWSFVHGLSFLMADDKLAGMGGPLALEQMLGDVSRRVLSDTPAP